MSEFRLPRLPRGQRIADKDGMAHDQFRRWWQSLVEQVEEQVNGILAAQAAAATAQAAAVVAQAAAATAQTAADSALADLGVIDERTRDARDFLSIP